MKAWELLGRMLVLVAAMGFGGGLLVGCQEEQSPVEEAAEEAQEGADEAADEAQDAADEAGDQLDDAME